MRGGHSPAAAPAHTGGRRGGGAPAPQCVRSPAALSRRHQPGRLLLHVGEVSRLGLRFQPSVPPQRLTPPSPLFPQPGSGPAQHRWTLPKGCARHRCHPAVPRPAAVRTPGTARQAGSRTPSADHLYLACGAAPGTRAGERGAGGSSGPSSPDRPPPPLPLPGPPSASPLPGLRHAGRGAFVRKTGRPQGSPRDSQRPGASFPPKFRRSPRRSGSAHGGLRSARMGGRWAGWLHPAVGTNFENGPCARRGCGADPGTAAAGGVGVERRRRAGRTRHLRSGGPGDPAGGGRRTAHTRDSVRESLLLPAWSPPPRLRGGCALSSGAPPGSGARRGWGARGGRLGHAGDSAPATPRGNKARTPPGAVSGLRGPRWVQPPRLWLQRRALARESHGAPRPPPRALRLRLLPPAAAAAPPASRPAPIALSSAPGRRPGEGLPAAESRPQRLRHRGRAHPPRSSRQPRASQLQSRGFWRPRGRLNGSCGFAQGPGAEAGLDLGRKPSPSTSGTSVVSKRKRRNDNPRHSRSHTASLLLFLMPGPLPSSPVSLHLSLPGSVCACSAFPCSPGKEPRRSVHPSPGLAPAQRVECWHLSSGSPSLPLLSDCMFSFPDHTILREVSLSASYFIFIFFSVTCMFEFSYFCFIFAFLN
ncbi:LOW QUALITY PROTEIN: collagen alpha-1(I) chain-like [Gorilla gorilla gorilla]|uniref:LOW QUALITY PROTEIN: collagen alpha-1(I) chain-like n=1 Tax=Gorilla gorilla gorilla TaxID=9595 RepID=UPI00300B8000